MVGLDDSCGVTERKVGETSVSSMARQTFCIIGRAVEHHWRSVANATATLAEDPVCCTLRTLTTHSAHTGAWKEVF